LGKKKPAGGPAGFGIVHFFFGKQLVQIRSRFDALVSDKVDAGNRANVFD
jgi:hypothetical protein